MTRPITPNEVADLKSEQIPEEVVQAFNELIDENWNGSCSVVGLDEAADRAAKLIGINDSVLYRNNWLDVEDIFREAGWEVDYMTCKAIFKFSKPRSNHER